MIAIITDNITVAKQIAPVLNMDMDTGDAGYFRGRGYIVAWVDGTLVSLSPPEDYGKHRLAKDSLPYIPETLTPAVRKKKSQRKQVTDKAAVKHLNVVKNIFDECESIVVATDAGEAGELAFRRIYSYLECKKPFKRLWLDSLTTGAIREGFRRLKEGAVYNSLHAMADCRAKADFLISVNAIRAFSLAAGLAGSPLGRLEVPVLAMVCRPYREYREFVPVCFHELRVTLEKDGQLRSFMLPVALKSRRKAEKIYEHLKAFHTARITKVEKHNRIQPAPQLYDMVSLQREANIRYGFPVHKTMEIARKLYEDKLISHPLTDSRQIHGDVFSSIPKILRQTAAYSGLAGKPDVLSMESLNRGSVRSNSNLPAIHHALIPTGVYQGYLPKEDKIIYGMIAERTMEAFAPDCQLEFTRVEATMGSLTLVSEQSKVTAPGWRSIRSREEDRKQDEAGENDAFPVFTEGGTVRISGWNLLTRKTMPRPLYTEASLLEAMVDSALGAAATRAPVIESLISCGYIERRGQCLVPTEKGQVVYNCLKDMRIADIQQAGGWERMLTDIGKGKQAADTFMTTFKIFTRQATEEILSLSLLKKPAPKSEQPNPAHGKRKKRTV
ncbi:DNA topoisomerase [Dysgonomonas reticulitermitis]